MRIYITHNQSLVTKHTGDSTRLLTGSGDSSVRLWDVQSGQTLFVWKTQEPCRAVKFAVGDRLAAFSTDPFMAAQSAIHFTRIAEDARCGWVHTGGGVWGGLGSGWVGNKAQTRSLILGCLGGEQSTDHGTVQR